MTTQMPDERDITKQQLWQRIDTVLETISTVARNTRDNVEAVLPALQREHEAALAEVKVELNDAVVDLNERMALKMKSIEKINNDGFSQTVSAGQQAKAAIDARLQSMNESIEAEMKNQIANSFQQISDMITAFNDNVTDFKKTTDAQMKAMQQEWGVKLGEITAAFDGMKKKFKKMSEQLS